MIRILKDMILDCILFSTADWDHPYWTNKQHTALELTRQGCRVLYIESLGLRSPGLTNSRDLRRLVRRFKRGIFCLLFGPPEAKPNLWVLSPLVLPFKHYSPLFSWLNFLLLRISLYRFYCSHAFCKPCIWTYHPYILRLVNSISCGPLLYHMVDDLSAVPGIDAYQILAAEAVLMPRCDVVFATSLPLLNRALSCNENSFFLDNVVDFDHFSLSRSSPSLLPELMAIPEPRLVYHGVLSDFKIDFKLLYSCACLRTELHWVLLGEEREGQHSPDVLLLKELPNVHFIGYVPYSQLPQYLSGMSVGLLPTLLNSYTESMFPMKFYEYIASGLPVVSTPIGFTRNVGDGLEIGSSCAEFLDAIDKQLKRGLLSLDESLRIVGQNTWRSRTQAMLEELYRSSEL